MGLSRDCRMVHAQTPRSAENLARAGDLQKYADTIGVLHRRAWQNISR
jgi:hypothetical protein